ncbi:protocatechuate 3,4-dioxygenase beta subunit [Loktanella sp. PT4BL]|jgi:protocatechuate 3,4-dioxygenase beta subunit|uniref:dioxygenase family protein n=1 Tax=Loktanella sp. PT4BL TaxID=2135611 RepID=UPI000D76A38A|nr:protocatechuate 3,4-dioxygenase [Loktanella sp. PT4BL]PXW70576.1 protocatechuate 3,4-dioxygenase beta subunit [Loktanella sp. PT4BL]
MSKTRRTVLAQITAFVGALGLGTQARAATPTPAATEGPFYPTPSMRMADVDNDLVKVTGLVQEAGGEVMILNGRVLDTDGRPRAGVRVEIWQCNMNGKYLHSGDRRDVVYDAGFQGFGHDITDAQGQFRFRTIRPTVYPGRTPHIHAKVLDGSSELLTTQFYLADHPENARDRLFNRMSDAQKAQVTMIFTAGPDGPETTVDIVI